ncbi:hypothetical protein C8Q77DRAFT_1152255 [Trametes polyzona]|nr:hypothetical protein C8Q77DRAFT_1152255 [Trametes polyzona]
MVGATSGPGAAFTSLSSDVAIQFILADIPVFAVGILAFGVLMFFFLMKRVDKWVFCLHLSVLLAFLAALFDLSQLLIRGREAVDLGLNTAGMQGLITAREVFYSFSDGLRFLFYWGFVATIPLGETMPEGTTLHSGSWQRWGMLGTILKWSTVVLVILITILQLVYRDVAAFEKIGPVYETEATLEIITSAIFILKLLLNTWTRFQVGSTAPTKGAMLVQYAPVIVALLFSLWIAVGNAILFNFTETALGRFLRAIELYIMIVYMMTVSFHHLRHLSFFPVYRPAPKASSRAATFQRDSMAKSSDEKFAASSPPAAVNEPIRLDLMQVLEQQYRQQDMPPTVMRDSSRSATIENVSQHQSMAARLSTWLGIARPLPRPPQQGQIVQSWDVDTERGPSPTAQSAPVQSWYGDEKPRMESPPLPPPPAIDEDEQRGVSPIPLYATNSFVQRDVASPAPSSHREYPQAPGIIEPSSDGEASPMPDRDWEEMEYSNAVRYSGVSEDMLAKALSQQYYTGQDQSRLQPAALLTPIPSRPESLEGGYPASPYPTSPIGSAVATPLPRSRPLPPMPRPNSALLSPSSPLPPDSARSSNMSILLRRQTELDESIAALRLFSPSKMAFDVSAMPVPPSQFYAQPLMPAVEEDAEQDQDQDQDQDYLEREYQGRLDVDRDDRDGQLSVVRSIESPELPAPSPDLTLATIQTPRADGLPVSSAQSEFSFSNFQHQPPLNRGSMDSGVIPHMGIAVEAPSVAGDEDEAEEGEGMCMGAESPMSELEPPRMPAAMTSRFSEDSSVGVGREQRVDSLGTQYEITSFIGNLTIPGSQKDSTISASSVAVSDEGSVNVAVATKADLSAVQYARPALVIPPPSDSEASPEGLTAPPQPFAAPSPIRTPSGGRRALPPLPQPSAQSGSLPARPLPPSMQQQQQQAAQPKPTQPTQAAAPTPRFRRAVGLPPRPRLSVVNLTPVEEKTTTSPSETLMSSPQSGSGTPPAGKRW